METALHCARTVAVAKVLLAHDPAKVPLLLSLKNHLGETALHTAAASPSDIQNGYTFFEYANRSKERSGLISLLLEYDADPNAPNNLGKTARELIWSRGALGCLMMFGLCCWFVIYAPCLAPRVYDDVKAVRILAAAEKSGREKEKEAQPTELRRETA